MERRRVPALLAASLLLCACGGSEAPRPEPKPKTPETAPAKEEPSGGSGFDLSALKGPEEPKKEEPKPPAPKAEEPKPPVAKAEDPKKEEPEPPAKPAKPGKAPPATPEEISELEVLGTWTQEEREALNEMNPGDREKEIRKRRLEIFKERGGKIDPAAAKGEPKTGEGPDGARGEARPEAVKDKELPPPALRDVLEDLASRDPEIRARGVESAKRFPDKAVAARHLIPLLEDKDADLRAIVCSTLGDLKQADAVGPLAKLIEKGDKNPVRQMALKALGDIGGAQSRAALREIVREGSEPSDRATALGQLVRQRDVGEVKDLLARALDDISSDVRQQAVMAIREFNLKTFEKDLYPRLADASENVIIEAIRAFAALGTREAVPELMKILLKPDPEAEDPEGLQEAANAALEIITGVRQGYRDDLPDAQKAAAIDSWRVWWNKNKATWK